MNIHQTKQNNFLLQQLGLSDNAASLYLTMLTHPKSSVAELTTWTSFPRTMLYYILNQLGEAGLVSSSKVGRRTVYVAKSPEQLYRLIEKRAVAVAQEHEQLKSLIPELKTQYRLAGKRPDTQLFDGFDAYQKVLDDMISTAPETIFTYYHPAVFNQPGLEMRQHWYRRCIRAHISRQVLLPKQDAALHVIREQPYSDFVQYRLIDEALFPEAILLQLYKGKLVHTQFYEHDLAALLIEDEDFFCMQKNFFALLWAQAEDATLIR